MDLYIAGINHFDPLCQFELRFWLSDLQAHIKTSPAFVAVEFSEIVFAAIQGQREEFRALLKADWPRLHATYLDILASSLAYEGDTHLEYFPTSQVLWLDAGRENDPACQRAMDSYAKDRACRHKLDMLGNAHLEATPDLFLCTMRDIAWSKFDPATPGTDRDRKWVAAILQRMEQRDSDCAVAIVGANHVSLGTGSMHSLLVDNGVPCFAHILDPR